MKPEEIQNIIVRGTQILEGVAPILGPLSVPVGMALKIVERVEPLAYAQILSWFEKGEPSPEEVAKLHEVIGRLKNPDQYFS